MATSLGTNAVIVTRIHCIIILGAVFKKLVQASDMLRYSHQNHPGISVSHLNCQTLF